MSLALEAVLCMHNRGPRGLNVSRLVPQRLDLLFDTSVYGFTVTCVAVLVKGVNRFGFGLISLDQLVLQS